MIKKVFLFFIVGLEIFMSGYFIKKYFVKSKILGSTKVSELRKEHFSTSQIDQLKFYTVLQEGRWEEQPDWLNYKVIYNINKDGLREDKDYEETGSSNVFRIIALGDSFTYGHHVNVENSWPKILEKALNNSGANCINKNIEVINLGMPGFDIQYITQRYSDKGKKYNPDLIIWLESGYGFYRHNEFTLPLVEECYKSSTESSKLSGDQNYYKYAKCSEEITQNSEKYFSSELHRATIENNLDIYTKIPNTKNTLYISFQKLSNRSQQLLDRWKNKYPQINFIQLIPDLTGDEILPDSHPSTIGHEIISRSIFDYLEKENIICN